MEINTSVSKHGINFKNIEEFEYFIKENKIKYIYYSDKKCFMVVFDSFVYSFSYDLEEGYYKTIEDYKNGMANDFTSGIDFYNAMEAGLKNQKEATYYKNSLFLSGKDYRDALEYDFIGEELKGKDYIPIIGLISKNDLRDNFYYANTAFSINYNSPRDFYETFQIIDCGIKSLDEFIEKYKKTEKKYDFYNTPVVKNITQYANNYFIYLEIKVPLGYKTNEKVDAAFFYYAKFAQYDSLSEFLASKVKPGNNYISSVRAFYIMKNTNNILKEMAKNKHNGFFESEDFKLLTTVLQDPRYIYPPEKKDEKHKYSDDEEYY